MLLVPRSFLFLLCLTAALAAPALGQPEVVPAEHAVYDFLHAQRVAGQLPAYRHEALPLDRASVQRHLDSLSARASALSGAMRYWLGEYRRAFFEPPDQIEQVLGGPDGLHLGFGADTEKFLYYYRDADWRVALQAIGKVQVRHAEEDTTYAGLAVVPEGILQGNYRDLIGFYSGTFDGNQFGGDTRVLQFDPVLSPLYYVGRADIPPGSFDRSTASLRVAGRLFSAEIAHARLRVGASADRPLLISDNADYFSFLRLGLDTRVVQYQFLHGALGDRSFNPLDSAFVLVGPERYLAMHRLTLQPHRRVSLAFTEAVVYGQRGPEIAYLNPFYPIKPAEHALWDRDNSLFALDAVVRPVDGIEAYGTYLVDDLDFGRIGQNSYNYKWAAQGGVAVALDRFVPGATGFAEYTRVEPFTYTHRFQLDDSFYNSYQHNGFGLGHPLGPNSDQVAAGLDVWLPLRSRARVVGRYVRRAENFVDEDGTFVNVGGDIGDGTQPPFDEFSKVFLRGDRFEGLGGTLELHVEPLRGLAFRLFGDVQQWDRAPNRLFVRGEVVVTL